MTTTSATGRQPLTVEVITSPSALPALQQDYRRLQELTANRLPFALFDWHRTWCEHFLTPAGRVRTTPALSGGPPGGRRLRRPHSVRRHAAPLWSASIS